MEIGCLSGHHHRECSAVSAAGCIGDHCQGRAAGNSKRLAAEVQFASVKTAADSIYCKSGAENSKRSIWGSESDFSACTSTGAGRNVYLGEVEERDAAASSVACRKRSAVSGSRAAGVSNLACYAVQGRGGTELEG